VTDPEEGELSFTGGVSEDGGVFAFPILDDYEPGLMIGIEKATNFTLEKTKGKYYIVETDDELSDCQNPQLGSWPWAGMTQIKLDGQGNGTFRDLYTSNTDDQDFPESGEFTYSVTSDGKMTITTPEGDLTGFISADGNLFVIPGLDPCDPGITIGIKASPTSLLAPMMLLMEE
jgi:hypothetical protein